jgi:hypothetical protein
LRHSSTCRKLRATAADGTPLRRIGSGLESPRDRCHARIYLLPLSLTLGCGVRSVRRVRRRVAGSRRRSAPWWRIDAAGERGQCPKTDTLFSLFLNGTQVGRVRAGVDSRGRPRYGRPYRR